MEGDAHEWRGSSGAWTALVGEIVLDHLSRGRVDVLERHRTLHRHGSSRDARRFESARDIDDHVVLGDQWCARRHSTGKEVDRTVERIHHPTDVVKVSDRRFPVNVYAGKVSADKTVGSVKVAVAALLYRS